MTGLDSKFNTSTDSPCLYCSRFLNWSKEKHESEDEKTEIFQSLVATVKLHPELDDALQSKAVKLLTSVVLYRRESADAFLNSLKRTSDDSLTDFIQSIVALLSSANKAIPVATVEMLNRLIGVCSTKVHLSLVKADLIPQLVTSLNPQSLSFAEAVNIHIYLMNIIWNSLWLSTPYGLRQVGIEDHNEQQTVHETVLTQVLAPSEKYIRHLCVSRFSIVNGYLSEPFLTLLAKLLRICPYYQLTMEFVLHMPIILTFLDVMFEVQRYWNETRGEGRQMVKKMHSMLRMEGIEDVMEAKLRTDQNAHFGAQTDRTQRTFRHVSDFLWSMRRESTTLRLSPPHQMMLGVSFCDFRRRHYNWLPAVPSLFAKANPNRTRGNDEIAAEPQNTDAADLALPDSGSLEHDETIRSPHSTISHHSSSLLPISTPLSHSHDELPRPHKSNLTTIDEYSMFGTISRPSIFKSEIETTHTDHPYSSTLLERRFAVLLCGKSEAFQNDTSFIKLSFFRPTLLSLRAKFQQLASSVDGSEDSSTSSLISSHSSPNTSLEALLDSSLRTLSSSSHFRQESLRLLTILHTLLTSPLPSSPTHKFRIEHFGPRSTLINPDTITPNEIFDSSLFDEADNEKLTRSLVRCKSVCELVGAEKCILDIEHFIDRTVSVLGTSDSLLRAAAGALFNLLEDVPCVLSMLPHLWNRLRSAFRDGPHEEQCALIRISSKWIISQMGDRSLPPFPATKFDWDGLINADLRDLQPFVFSVFLILFLQHRSIKEQIGSGQRDSITQSFEMHQHAVSRIITIFEDIIQRLDGADDDLNLISYCLLISLRFNRDFPPTLTSILTLFPEIEAHTLLPLENIFLWLCHSSLNRHKPHQPPLDFLFERTLRMSPLEFFLHDSEPDAELSHSLLNTSLCGFHALCRRGMHLDVMASELVRSGEHLANSFLLFSSPLISDTFDLFLYFPPSLVVRFFLPILSSLSNPSFLVEPLRAMATTLFFVTAPFGDCHSLKELCRSVRQLNTIIQDSSPEPIVSAGCESLEWLNIPTGFESALAHSHSRVSFDPFDDQLSAFHSSSHSPDNTNLSTAMFTFLSNQVQNVSNRICLSGLVTQHLNRSNAPVFLRSKFPDLCGTMLNAEIVVTCFRPDRLVSHSYSTTPVHDLIEALGSFSEGKRRGSDKRSCHLSWSVRLLVDM
ncbi:hypothetical protein BLNAU_20943 [Blattamonas nauphoetae]|uniref:Uncharacterized protein n=1 Tax=Blattamonas nauphoetae TaxID=2049346 RepID=A0ABQ9X0G1_9EUKA|nr:hypothetical protein BLNAU_20943 [Blattamonas nauphoetae]